MTFHIEWSIKASDWEVARTASLLHHRGSDYDREMMAMEELLPAHIRFLQDDKPLSVLPLGENDWIPFFGVRRRGALVQTDPAKSELISGWGVWMPDFAIALAQILWTTRDLPTIRNPRFSRTPPTEPSTGFMTRTALR